jgi:hypothetical protein
MKVRNHHESQDEIIGIDSPGNWCRHVKNWQIRINGRPHLATVNALQVALSARVRLSYHVPVTVLLYPIPDITLSEAQDKQEEKTNQKETQTRRSSRLNDLLPSSQCHQLDLKLKPTWVRALNIETFDVLLQSRSCSFIIPLHLP